MPTKLTIEDAHSLAKSKGLQFLSNQYHSWKINYLWRCSKGHEWITSYAGIVRGNKCTQCYKLKAKTIEDAQQLAESRGFKFLSTEVKGVNNKYNWECNKGHIWSARYDHIKAGSSCPECSGKKRKTITDAQNLAESRGFKFLSGEFKNIKTDHLWECQKGHQWYAKYNTIQQGGGCQKCFFDISHSLNKVKKTIEDAQNLAENRGFKFLSNEFSGVTTKYFWECSKGHVWGGRFSSIQNGQGCPFCASVSPKSMDDVQNLAKIKGFKFLSKEYKNAHTKYLWGCSKGHKWISKYYNIHSGYGCPDCANVKPRTITDAQTLASKKGLKFLSTEFKNTKTKYLWACHEGHEWISNFNDIDQGYGCPDCSGTRLKNIQDVHDLAKMRGFKFLSTEYTNAHTKYLWGCSKGHKWISPYYNIHSGSGCPFCSDKTRGEKLTRYCFEKFFDCDFKKIRPDWMRNPQTNYPLELDGYNENMNLAFEHQGIQHEKDCPTSNRFYNPKQLVRDEIKREKCKERGITLIEVPEIGRRLKLKDVVPFLLSEFDKHNIAYPESAKSFQIDMREFYAEYMNEKSTTGVDDLLSELDAMDFSDDSLFVDSIMDEVNDLDFDDPDLFN
jgi:hypothetical protein